ncbi:hypothetical protein COLO4_18153 [Corchorus olitorius]|uniref:Uncharacterized protein n=1 Tax=Corchorus olitorius TaxID=93759 RepID=A0A1R3JA55_9ROSI|nr:hypothetical protein COLO4_18153 [Corchorus olitorius]
MGENPEGSDPFEPLAFFSCPPSSFFTLHFFSLCVACLSGRQTSSGQQFGTYGQDDIDALRAFAEEPGIVDLFLTYPLLC